MLTINSLLVQIGTDAFEKAMHKNRTAALANKGEGLSIAEPALVVLDWWQSPQRFDYSHFLKVHWTRFSSRKTRKGRCYVPTIRNRTAMDTGSSGTLKTDEASLLHTWHEYPMRVICLFKWRDSALVVWVMWNVPGDSLRMWVNTYCPLRIHPWRGHCLLIEGQWPSPRGCGLS